MKQSVKQSYGEQGMDAYLSQLSESTQIPLRRSFPSIIVIGELQSAPVVHAAFKTVFDAIELAMICKRGAPSPRTVGLIEVFGRGSGRAACVSSVKIFSRVWLHSCLHKLYLLVNNCTFCCVSSGFDSDA